MVDEQAAYVARVENMVIYPCAVCEKDAWSHLPGTCGVAPCGHLFHSSCYTSRRATPCVDFAGVEQAGSCPYCQRVLPVDGFRQIWCQYERRYQVSTCIIIA